MVILLLRFAEPQTAPIRFVMPTTYNLRRHTILITPTVLVRVRALNTFSQLFLHYHVIKLDIFNGPWHSSQQWATFQAKM